MVINRKISLGQSRDIEVGTVRCNGEELPMRYLVYIHNEGYNHRPEPVERKLPGIKIKKKN